MDDAKMAEIYEWADEDVKSLINAWSLNDIMVELKTLLHNKGHLNHIDYKDVYATTALIHTEVSEYTQLYKRYGLDAEHREDRAEEIADIIFRALNLAIMEKININEALFKKMKKNWARPYKYGTSEERKDDDATI